MTRVGLHAGEALAQYGFGAGHPFGPDRFGAFWQEASRRRLPERCEVVSPVMADRSCIEMFHAPVYVDRVIEASRRGTGWLDQGDTPAFPGVFEAAATVVGTSVDAARRIMQGEYCRAFSPIAGLHHAQRGSAAGFCVFNDCGVVIEVLRREFGVRRIAYVDIDAHHGDGVFYSYEGDPDLAFADLHEDGRHLYPGTGFSTETGRGAAEGTKLNIPLPPGADDAYFRTVWPRVEVFLEIARPEFILLQCGADSLRGDPLTHLALTETTHAHVAHRLCRLADTLCAGRLLAMGGGGYDRGNLARAWCGVVEVMLGTQRDADLPGTNVK